MSNWTDQPCRGDAESTDGETPMDVGLPLSTLSLRTPSTETVFRSIVKARKSYKTYRGGEVVWPPELEAALLEGLESYQPDDSRETRLLGRFPLRNRFISDYIFDKTGKRRNPKQVGSRLQQLRDTCGGKQLESLLSPCRQPGIVPTNYYYRLNKRGSDISPPNSPLTPRAQEMNANSVAHQREIPHCVICIDVLPEDPHSPTLRSSMPVADGSSSPPLSPTSDGEVRVYPRPRAMRYIDPTVTFVSQHPIKAHSRFTVRRDNLNVHSETVPLVLGDTSSSEKSSRLYSAALIPEYWQTIVTSPDPTRYTILQEIVQDDSSIKYSVLFKFCYPTGYSPTNSSCSAHSSPTTTPDPQSSYFAAGLTPSGHYYAFDQQDGAWDVSRCSEERPPTLSTDRSPEVYTRHAISPISTSLPTALSNYML